MRRNFGGIYILYVDDISLSRCVECYERLRRLGEKGKFIEVFGYLLVDWLSSRELQIKCGSEKHRLAEKYLKELREMGLLEEARVWKVFRREREVKGEVKCDFIESVSTRYRIDIARLFIYYLAHRIKQFLIDEFIPPDDSTLINNVEEEVSLSLKYVYIVLKVLFSPSLSLKTYKIALEYSKLSPKAKKEILDSIRKALNRSVYLDRDLKEVYSFRNVFVRMLAGSIVGGVSPIYFVRRMAAEFYKLYLYRKLFLGDHVLSIFPVYPTKAFSYIEKGKYQECYSYIEDMLLRIDKPNPEEYGLRRYGWIQDSEYPNIAMLYSMFLKLFVTVNKLLTIPIIRKLSFYECRASDGYRHLVIPVKEETSDAYQYETIQDVDMFTLISRDVRESDIKLDLFKMGFLVGLKIWIRGIDKPPFENMTSHFTNIFEQ